MTSHWNAQDFADLGKRKRGFGMTLPQVTVSVILMLCGGVLVVRHVRPGSGDTVVQLRSAADRALAKAAVTIPGVSDVSDVDPTGDAARRRATLALATSSRPANDDPSDALATPGVVRRTDVRGETRLMGDVDGLLVVHPGTKLVLEDVVLHGGIVSAGTTSDLDAGDAPRIAVRGTLRIDPCDALPDVAVLVPEGVLVAEGADTSVQIHGDVICRALRLAGSGSLVGRVDTASPPQLSPRVTRLDDARLPSHAGRARQLAAAGALAALPDTDVSWDEVTSMTAFEFPGDRGR